MGAQCVECLLRYLDNIVQYFNKYAFVYVAAYGKTFKEGGKDCWDLMTSRGFEALWNDDLIGNVLIIGAISCGLLNGALWALVASGAGLKLELVLLVGIVALLVGFAFTIMMTISVESGVATIFVLYAEDPRAFEANHPELYTRFVDALRSQDPRYAI